jgi:hypothetical protein
MMEPTAYDLPISTYDIPQLQRLGIVRRSWLTGNRYLEHFDIKIARQLYPKAFQTVKENNKYSVRCEFWLDGCDYRSPSGIAMQAHVQTEHVSKNDRHIVFRNKIFMPKDWWREGRITDIRGRQEDMNWKSYQIGLKARNSTARDVTKYSRHIA